MIIGTLLIWISACMGSAGMGAVTVDDAPSSVAGGLAFCHFDDSAREGIAAYQNPEPKPSDDPEKEEDPKKKEAPGDAEPRKRDEGSTKEKEEEPSVGPMPMPQPPITPAVDAILTRFERRSAGLKDIRCKVEYTEVDQINLSETRREGEILFLMAEPNPLFLVRFDKLVVDGVVREERYWYLFDGQWLHEADERIRQVIHREVVRSGEKLEMFDLERSPFPLPFGQKKSEIVEHFRVDQIDAKPGDPPRTDHLMCVPRINSRLAREYDRLDFFISRDLHLPLRIKVTKNKGLEVSAAVFPDLSEESLNRGVKRDAFDLPNEWSGYAQVREPLPDEGAPKPKGPGGVEPPKEKP
jgi:hypothetical protein